MVEIHHYKVWKTTTGAWDFPTAKLTAQAIAELHGEIIPDTFESVFQSMLDAEGRYVPWSAGNAPDSGNHLSDRRSLNGG